MSFKDRFSQQADLYALHRPTYPDELYQFVLQQVKDPNYAWDCATGNGQVASVLSNYFKKVFATDISQKQLDHASKLPNIEYTISPAEETPFPGRSIDLITVGQALHWFNFEQFYKEVKRVSKAGTILAAWGYGLLQVNSDIDLLIYEFYKEITGPYWDPERQHVDAAYQSIPFPFQEIRAPRFKIVRNWDLNALTGYLSTWSSVRKYQNAKGYDPVEEFAEKLAAAWGHPGTKHEVIFDVFMRIGEVR